MSTPTKRKTIGQLAKDAGVGIDTVRFYERAGLIPKPARTPSGYRTYTEADVARLRFVRRAKELGFSLEEVSELLRLNEGKGARASVRALAERRVRDLDVKLRQLQALRDTLAHHVEACSGQGPLEGCPIIDAVLGTAHPENSTCSTHTPPKTTPAARRRPKP